MKKTIGYFTEPVEVEGLGKVYMRGLTVGEYIDLSRRGFLTSAVKSDRDYLQIARTCLVDCEVDSETMDEYKELTLHLNEESAFDVFNVLGLENLVLLGKIVIEDLTLVSDELEQKAKGYARYIHLQYDKKNASILESFDCKNCLQRGVYFSRVCGRFSEEEARDHITELNGDKVSASKAASKVQASTKYSSRKLARRKAQKDEERQEKSSRGKILMLNKFQFPECPVSWIPEWLWTAGGILFHSDRANIPFFGGGLADQPYQLYKISRIIGGESAAIEEENRDK